MSNRQNRLLVGSLARAADSPRATYDRCCGVMISRCSRLHPPAAIRRIAGANQSSNSGWLGGSPNVTEIAGRADDAAAKMVLPDAIDHDTRGQRVLGRGDPVGQLATASTGLGLLGRSGDRNVAAAEQARKARTDLLARNVRVAALQNKRVGGLGARFGYGQSEIGRRLLVFQFFELLLQILIMLGRLLPQQVRPAT